MQRKEELILPKVFVIGGYYIYFWTSEGIPLEPVHVHVNKGSPVQNATKIWLTSSGKCLLENNNSRIPEHELSKIMLTIEAQFFYICAKWKDTFGDNSLKFYC